VATTERWLARVLQAYWSMLVRAYGVCEL
jgi:hypothetical protein